MEEPLQSGPQREQPRRVKIGGVPMDDVSEAEAVEAIAAGIGRARQEERGLNVVTPNMDHLWLLGRDAAFRQIYRDAFLVLCDGKPLTWIARRQGTPLRGGVVPGSSLFVSLCAEAPRRDWRLFFFGGAPGRAEEAALILRERFPGLRVVGIHCPPLGFERDEKLWAEGVASLKQAHEGTEGPLDLIFLALGAPKSEKTAARLIAEGGPPAVYVNVGAAFDFVCGKPKRAPAWMRRVGLEWFWRLARDPRRLFRRYILRDLPLFLALMARPDRSKTKQP